MIRREKIIDDLAQFAGGAAGLASGISRQIRSEIRARADELILRMDFIPRSEFERLEALCHAMEKRIEALEGKTNTKATKKKS